MPQASESSPKEALRRKLADYVLEQGLSELSLRPIARELGTSTRMLLYHFGSKEQLVVEALDEARGRLRALVAEWVAAQDGRRPDQVLRRFFDWLCEPEQRPFLRLSFEVYVLSVQRPERYPGYAERTVQEWLETFATITGDGSAQNPAESRLGTLMVAAHRGLLLDLLATGDHERCREAMRLLHDALEPQHPVLRGR